MMVWQNTPRPAFQKLYTVAGRFLFVETHDGWAGDLFERFFADWYISPLDGRATVHRDATIRINSDVAPPGMPDGLESFDVASGGRCYTDGQTYFLICDGSLIRIGGGSETVVDVWIGESAHSRRPPALARVVFNAVQSALRRCGLYELHAGGVFEPTSGTGALIIGASGSGKTTLTMQLAASGWRFLSDDTILLEDKQPGVEARGFRRVFAVREQAAVAALESASAQTARRAAPRVVPFDTKKVRFAPEELFPSGHMEHFMPAALFFPIITHERQSRVENLAQSDAMARLMRMCPWSCYDRRAAKEHLRVLARLAKQSVAYRLYAGEDLLGEAAHVSDFLSAHIKSKTS